MHFPNLFFDTDYISKLVSGRYLIIKTLPFKKWQSFDDLTYLYYYSETESYL